MGEVVAVVRGCEKGFGEVEGGEEEGGKNENRDEVVNEAVQALKRLEVLLIKEGLFGVPLANTYRSLAKWVERKDGKNDEEVVGWKVKELEVCIIGFGRDAQRTSDIERGLRELSSRSVSFPVS